MKTLIIQYLPRAENSNTKKLVDAFLEKVNDVEILDLTKEQPEFFLPVNLAAYQKRNYGGQELTPEEAQSLASFDRFVKQLKTADVVVLAYPMYNFSVPGAVKTWFDAVALKGETWDMEGGQFKGLMTGKKALILTTSGGVYEGDFATMDHSLSLAKGTFEFMGYTVETVSAQGLNMMVEKVDDLIKEAQDKVKALIDQWYGPS